MEVIVEAAISLIQVQIKTHDSMKVRWNASYAAGLVLKNKSFGSSIQHRLSSSLLESVSTAENLKVKMSACNALLHVSHVNGFNSSIESVLSTVLVQLKSAENEDDNTTPHRFELLSSLFILVFHFIALATVEEDAKRLQTVIGEDQIDEMRYIMSQISHRLPPEKYSHFVEAKERIKSLALECNHWSFLQPLFDMKEM